MRVRLVEYTGDFAEDKDAAARIRRQTIEPALAEGKKITLDFSGVRLTTQSFIHALISNVLRQRGESALDLLEFKSCNRLVRGLVATVVQYSLETLDEYGG